MTWCDLCLPTDVKVSATTHTLTLDGRTRTLDLCDGCVEAVVKPLQAMLDRYGQPVSADGKVKRPYRRRQSSEPEPGATGQPGEPAADDAALYPFACIVCDHEPFTNRSGLFRHYGTRHGYPTTTERGDGVTTESVYGATCPLCGTEPSSFVGHARTEHRQPISALFTAAAAAGDPHGVVAAVRAAVPTP